MSGFYDLRFPAEGGMAGAGRAGLFATLNENSPERTSRSVRHARPAAGAARTPWLSVGIETGRNQRSTVASRSLQFTEIYGDYASVSPRARGGWKETLGVRRPISRSRPSPKGGWSLQTTFAHKSGPARDPFSGLHCASGGGSALPTGPSPVTLEDAPAGLRVLRTSREHFAI